IAGLSFAFDGGADNLLGNARQLRRLPHNSFFRHADVPFLAGLLQHIAKGGASAQRRSAVNAEPASQLVGGLETKAPYIGSQAIGIAFDQLDGLLAVCFVDAHRPAGADAVRLQKDHDVAHRLLFLPAFSNALDAARPNALDLLQKRRAFVDDLQRAFAEDSDDLLGEVRPDALNQTRTKIFLDALDGMRRR